MPISILFHTVIHVFIYTFCRPVFLDLFKVVMNFGIRLTCNIGMVMTGLEWSEFLMKKTFELHWETEV